MSITDLEAAIRENITAICCKKYTGMLRVIKTDDCIEGGYTLLLGLNCPERPIQLSLQGTDQDKFLKYISKELTKRRFDFIKYFDGYRVINECKTDE